MSVGVWVPVGVVLGVDVKVDVGVSVGVSVSVGVGVVTGRQPSNPGNRGVTLPVSDVPITWPSTVAPFCPKLRAAFGASTVPWIWIWPVVIEVASKKLNSTLFGVVPLTVYCVPFAGVWIVVPLTFTTTVVPGSAWMSMMAVWRSAAVRLKTLASRPGVPTSLMFGGFRVMVPVVGNDANCCTEICWRSVAAGVNRSSTMVGAGVTVTNGGALELPATRIFPPGGPAFAKVKSPPTAMSTRVFEAGSPLETVYLLIERLPRVADRPRRAVVLKRGRAGALQEDAEGAGRDRAGSGRCGAAARRWDGSGSE